MPVVGFNITKLEGKRDQLVKGDIKVSRDIRITNISEHNLNMDKIKQNALQFDFEFSVKYDLGFGNIFVGGNVLYVEEKKKIDGILKEWEKNKKVDPELVADILNRVLVRCNIKAFNLEHDLNLPPHMQFPMVVAKKEEIKDYIG